MIDYKQVSEKIDVDVCVLGAAGSGLSAAVRAKECGAGRVLVLERNHRPGGCTRVAMQIHGVGSNAQERLGIHASFEQVFREHMKIQNWDCNGRLVSRWFHESGHVLDWLESMGAQFDTVLPSGNFDDGTMRYDHQTVGAGITTGSEIVRVLTERCKALGVEIRCNTRGRKLMLDACGDVCGVYATSGETDQGLVEVHASKVIIATGSITNNRELVSQLMEERLYSLATKVEAALKHNTGDGLLMAQEAGAKLGGVSPLYMGPHNHPGSNPVCMLMRRPQVFTVNKMGERYIDESILAAGGGYLWMNGVALNNQPGKVSFAIVDEACLSEMLHNRRVETTVEIASGKMDSGNYNSNYDTDEDRKWLTGGTFEWMDKLRGDLEKEQAAGRVLIAETMEEIADWIGADIGKLKASVEEYNSFCLSGSDEHFAKNKKYLHPVSTPPYYVIKGWQGIDTIIGGITIDSHLRVLNDEYRPIKNLYAVGVAASGWLGKYYGLPGSEMSFVCTSGFLAGEYAANSLT